VFCGLDGSRLQRTIFAGIIARSASRAGLSKHVTAHTLRHTAATWLRETTATRARWPSTWVTRICPP
jgi:integrase